MSEQRRQRVSPTDPATWPVGLKLKFLLWERRLQQKHLARELGISEGLLSRILADEQTPGAELRQKIARWSRGFVKAADFGEVDQQLVEQHGNSDQASAVRPSRRRKDIAA